MAAKIDLLKRVVPRGSHRRFLLSAVVVSALVLFGCDKASEPNAAVAASRPSASSSSAPRPYGDLNVNAARLAHWALLNDLRNAANPSVRPNPYRNDALAFLHLDDSVTASEYAAAYSANEIAADNRFKGKTFALTGVVTGINRDAAGVPYLGLLASDGLVKAQLRSDQVQKAAMRSKGDEAFLVCRGAGMTVPVVIADDCVSIGDYLLSDSEAQAKHVSAFLHGKEAFAKPFAEDVVSFYAVGMELPADSPCFKEPGGSACAAVLKPFATDPKLLARLDVRAKELRGLNLQEYIRN
ncbi:OB-fold protein [Burkholderia sp. ABCPW 111]|uniref:OB-fold protein n=1 Tax=Burkholderia sp. ABCPW 111 TaxID=1820025 RepID=UPI0005321C4A|nr:hypothetical protein [Burkholderia sp. ABCPW 111]KGS08760.1 tRNA_anti-like family protein [Burkholderia sp. ABCPW 111]